MSIRQTLYKKRNTVRFVIGEVFIGISLVGAFISNDLLWGTMLAVGAFLFGMNYEQSWFKETEPSVTTSELRTGEKKEEQ